jgi:esterase
MMMSLSASDQIEHLKQSSKIAGMDLPELVLPSEKYVELGELRLHYLDWAGPGATTIVFLHGAALTAHTWDLVCLALRDRFHCLALDARGHGDSGWPADRAYGIEAHVGDVEGLVQALGLDQFVLVGHSMGGGTALAYAGRNSSRLRALVAVDTGPRPPSAEAAVGNQRVRDFIAGPAELASVDDFVERAVQFNPLRDRQLLRRSLLHNLRQLPDGRWTWKYDRDGLMARNAVHADARRKVMSEAIPAIECPTLVIRGGVSDHYADEDAEYLVSILPNGRWRRVENAGHTVQGDNPRGLCDALNGFFAEIGL